MSAGNSQGAAGRAENEADARRATSALYHVASAVSLAWEGVEIDARLGDARRALLPRLVVAHRLYQPDAFNAGDGNTEFAIAE